MFPTLHPQLLLFVESNTRMTSAVYVYPRNCCHTNRTVYVTPYTLLQTEDTSLAMDSWKALRTPTNAIITSRLALYHLYVLRVRAALYRSRGGQNPSAAAWGEHNTVTPLLNARPLATRHVQATHGVFAVLASQKNKEGDKAMTAVQVSYHPLCNAAWSAENTNTPAPASLKHVAFIFVRSS